MKAVLDASAALAVLLGEQETNDIQIALETLSAVVVPDLWLLEIGNRLTREERRKRFKNTTKIFEKAIVMPKEIIPLIPSEAIAIHALALDTGLTTYDACYLHLAKTRWLPLLTLDQKLAVAARAEGVTVLP